MFFVFIIIFHNYSTFFIPHLPPCVLLGFVSRIHGKRVRPSGFLHLFSATFFPRKLKNQMTVDYLQLNFKTTIPILWKLPDNPNPWSHGLFEVQWIQIFILDSENFRVQNTELDSPVQSLHFIETKTRTKFSQFPVQSFFSFNIVNQQEINMRSQASNLELHFFPFPGSLLSKINISTYLLAVSIKKLKCIFV